MKNTGTLELEKVLAGKEKKRKQPKNRFQLFFVRFFLLISKPLHFLRNYPVLYRGKKFQIVNFGIFAAIEGFAVFQMTAFYVHIKGIKIDKQLFLLFILCAVMVWASARIFHLLALGSKFLKNPKKYLSETGFYVHGGIIGGIIWGVITSTITTYNIFIFYDALALGFLIGQFFGRLGCFNYGCCFGKETGHTCGIQYSNMDSKILRLHPEMRYVYIHPAQLYTAFLHLSVFMFLIFRAADGLPNGVISLFFLVYHGISRILIEHIRRDIHFSEGRNWITYKTAVISIMISLLLFFSGHYFDSAFLKTTRTVRPFTPDAFLSFNLQNQHAFAVSMIISLFLFLGYGIHGKKLGTFPKLF